MDAAAADFVHPDHFLAFVGAAKKYSCHILVRRTGRASLQYVGKIGYTGKRADMKAKTAKRNSGPYQTEGLVCSPYIHPGACAADAIKYWQMSAHLITVPPEGAVDDREQPRWCRTPYIVQTNKRHKHYGCVAWVESGLLAPRYVHGDYDLYAIIPNGYGPKLTNMQQRVKTQPMIVTTMNFGSSLPLQARLDAQSKTVTDLVGPLTFEVTNFLNIQIAKTEPSLMGALMVNHGEHINQGLEAHDYQPVLAFMPYERDGVWAKILRDQREHEAFYRDA